MRVSAKQTRTVNTVVSLQARGGKLNTPLTCLPVCREKLRPEDRFPEPRDTEFTNADGPLKAVGATPDWVWVMTSDGTGPAPISASWLADQRPHAAWLARRRNQPVRRPMPGAMA